MIDSESERARRFHAEQVKEGEALLAELERRQAALLSDLEAAIANAPNRAMRRKRLRLRQEAIAFHDKQIRSVNKRLAPIREVAEHGTIGAAHAEAAEMIAEALKG